MRNFTEEKQARKIKSFQSCLIKLPNRGLIRLPSGVLVLRLDPKTSMKEPENVVSILLVPQLGPFFGTFVEVARELPSSLVSHLEGQFFDHVRFNLAQLMVEDLTDEALTTVVKRFPEPIRIRHVIGICELCGWVLLSLGLGLFSLSLMVRIMYFWRNRLSQPSRSSISGCWHRRQ